MLFFNASAQLILTFSVSNYSGYNISCFGGHDGSIDITVTGGSGSYTYQWSNNSQTEDIQDLQPGYYHVEVRDINTSETADQDFTLSQPDQLQLPDPVISHYGNYGISLYGACNGSIQITPTGGASPYTYLWSDQNTSHNRWSLCTGQYSVSVTDANGCRYQSEHYNISEPPPIEWSMGGNANVTTSQYLGTSDGSDVVFKTNNTERFKISGNGSLTLNSLAGSSISVMGIDANGILSRSNFIGYQTAQSGHAEIYSFGHLPAAYNNFCSMPQNFLSNYQFNGPIQCFNTPAGVNPTAVLQTWFDGQNGNIEMMGTNPSGTLAPRLLLDYYCGKDVFVGNTTSGDLTANRNLYVLNRLGIGTSVPSVNLDVIGDIRSSNLSGNTGFNIVNADNNGILRTLTPPASNSNQFVLFGDGSWGQLPWMNIGTNIFNNPLSANVGIGTQTPFDKFQVNEGANRFSVGSAGGTDLDWGTSYIGFNSVRTSTGWKSSIDGSGGHNGGGAIWGTILGDINFSLVQSQINPTNDQTKTDLEMKNNVRMSIKQDANIKFNQSINQVVIGPVGPTITNSWSESYIGFNVYRVPANGQNNPYWYFDKDGISSGGSGIVCDAGGTLRIFSLASAGNNPQYLDDNGMMTNTRLIISPNGKVGIGVSGSHWGTGDYNLYVSKGIRTESVKIDVAADNDWADFVFDKKYKLISLVELAKYIELNKHLPEVPTTEEVKKDGIDIAAMQSKLLEKVEELTLYVIQLNNQNKELSEKLEKFEKK